MFERYSEEARKSVFFARYEASVSASPEIAPVHLLLGVLQADAALALRMFGTLEKVEAVRQRLVKPASSTSTTVDLPLSAECKRALAFACEEAERTDQLHVGSAHLLAGLILEADTPASALLIEMGVTLKRVRLDLSRMPPPEPQALQKREQADLSGLVARLRENLSTAKSPDFSTDLTKMAFEEHLDPVIGREAELERVLQILLRRYKNWVALTGEAGVGKTALLCGVAQCLWDGMAYQSLGGRRVVAVDAGLLPGHRNLCEGCVVLCAEGLFDLPVDQVGSIVRTLQGQARQADARIVATGTPEGFRRLPEPLSHLFELVELSPPSEAEAIRILSGMKEKYEKFHAVGINDDALAAAVIQSRRFLSRRLLPDRAIDLLDEACAYARLKHQKELTAGDIAAVVAARAR